jgi:hypothetical protein
MTEPSVTVIPFLSDVSVTVTLDKHFYEDQEKPVLTSHDQAWHHEVAATTIDVCFM